MSRRTVLTGLAAGALLRIFPSRAGADELLKIGICIPMTGAGFNAVGRQLSSAIKLYVEQHGDVVAGRKLEIVMRDDGGVADNARRIVQEMIVRDKASLIAIGITPTSLAIAPLVTEAKIATLVLSSGASITVTKSPYMVRAGFVLAPQSWIMAEWAAQNGSKRVVTLVNDWAPGIEAETAFRMRFTQQGGQILEAIRVPGDELIEAMKGMSWESPRGPISIDPQTRDIVSNIYIRKVEKMNGHLYNTEFATFEAVKDPLKALSK